MGPERVIESVLALAFPPDSRLPGSIAPGRPTTCGREGLPTSHHHEAMDKPTAHPAMTNATDREIVDRVRGGDMGAFAEFVTRHQRRIHRLATHLLHDRAEAEDVTQETFIRAFRALDRFDGRSEPYTWLYRIAVNLSLNVLRSRRNRGATSDVDDPRFDSLVASEVPSAPSPPATASRQLYEALAAGIDELSESLRTTLILVCITAGRTRRRRRFSVRPREPLRGASTRREGSCEST